MSVVVGPALIGVGSAAGCAVLAFWLVLRRPGLGPQTLRSCMAAAAGAFGLLTFLGPAVHAAVGAVGPAVALLGVADPVLVFSFWSGALLIRAFVGRAAHGNT